MAALENQGIVAACSSKRKEPRGRGLFGRYTTVLALYCTHIDVHNVFKSCVALNLAMPDSRSALVTMIILLKRVSRCRFVLGELERPTHRRSPKHTSSWPFQVRETGSHVGRLFTGISFLMR